MVLRTLHLNDDCWSFSEKEFADDEEEEMKIGQFLQWNDEFSYFLIIRERNKVKNQLAYWTLCECKLEHRTGC